MARTDYIALIEALVRDDAGHISDAERDDALALAVLRYGEDRPRADGSAHTLTATESTIPAADREAVCAYAAALLEQLAARHAGDSEPAIQADAVARQSLSERYLRIAQGHRARYASLLGVGAPPAPAGVTVALGQPPGRRAGLTH